MEIIIAHIAITTAAFHIINVQAGNCFDDSGNGLTWVEIHKDGTQIHYSSNPEGTAVYQICKDGPQKADIHAKFRLSGQSLKQRARSLAGYLKGEAAWLFCTRKSDFTATIN